MSRATDQDIFVRLVRSRGGFATVFEGKAGGVTNGVTSATKGLVETEREFINKILVNWADRADGFVLVTPDTGTRDIEKVHRWLDEAFEESS